MATDLTKEEPNERPRSVEIARRPSTGLAASFYTIKQYRSFRFLWIGNFFTVGAQWLQILTIGWLVLELTGGNAL